MAQFAPYEKAAQPPSYIGLSKEIPGPKPNKAAGIAFEGLADIFSMAVSGIDEINQQNIERDATAGYEAENARRVSELQEQIRLGGGGTPGERDSLDPLNLYGDKVPGVGETGPELLPKESAPAQGGVPVTDAAGGLVTDPTQRTDSVEGPLPGDAQLGVRQLGRVNAGALQGKIGRTERQMHGDAVTSDLLQRYGPGYAKQIYAAAGRHGFGPGRQIAALEAELAAQRAGQDKQATQIYQWEQTHRDMITKLMPTYWDMPRETRYSDSRIQDQLNKQIGIYNQEAMFLKEQGDKLDYTKKFDENQKVQAERLMSKENNLALAINFTGFMNSRFGVNATQNDPSVAINNFMSKPENFTPENIEKVGQAIVQFENAFVAERIRYYYNTPIKGLPGESQGSLMGTAKITELAQNELKPITGEFKRALSEGGAKANFDIFSSNVRFNQARMEQNTRNVRERFPSAEKLETLTKMLGPQGASDVISGIPEFKTSLNREMRMFLTGTADETATGVTNPATGKPHTISDTIDDYNKLKLAGEGTDGKPLPPRAVDMESLMEHTYSRIMNKNIPDDVAKKFAQKVFTDPRLGPKILDSEKMNFMRKYAGPEMGERIYSFKDPELILGYKKFVTDGVVAASNSITGNVNDIKSFGEFTTNAKKLGIMPELKYNPETNRVEGQVPSAQQIRGAVSNPTQAIVMEAQALKANQMIRDINTTLGVMEPVFSRDGPASIPPGLLSVMNRLGIPVTAPAATTPATAPATAPAKRSEGPTATPVSTTSITREGQNFATLMQDPNTPVTIGNQNFTVAQLRQMMGGPTYDTAQIQQLQGRQFTETPGGKNLSDMTPQEIAQLNQSMAPGTTALAAEQPSAVAAAPAQQAIAQAAPTAASTTPPAAQPAAYPPQTRGGIQESPALRLIRAAEHVPQSSGYNTIYGGGEKPLGNMTVDQLIAYQRGLPRNERAAGIAQFMPDTLESLKKEMQLTGNEKMTPAVQQQMTEVLMERRGLSRWREGKISDEQFINNLAKEWAGLPNTTGKSHYQGDAAGNKARVPLRDVYKMLDELRNPSTGTPGSRSDAEGPQIKEDRYRGPAIGVEITGRSGADILQGGAARGGPRGRTANENKELKTADPKDFVSPEFVNNLKTNIREQERNLMQKGASWTAEQRQNAVDSINRFKARLELVEPKSDEGIKTEEQGMLSKFLNKMGFGSSSNMTEGRGRVPEPRTPEYSNMVKGDTPTEFPTRGEALQAQRAGYAYGSEWESYFNNELVNVLGTMTQSSGKGDKGRSSNKQMKFEQGSIIDVYNNLTQGGAGGDSVMVDMKKDPKFAEISADLSDKFARAALAANRNSVATLGFSPKDTIISTESKSGGGLLGLFNPKTNEAYSTIINPSGSTIVHESIHRGIDMVEKTAKGKEIMSRLPKDDELIVRWIMHSQMNDIERGFSDSTQIDKAKKLFEANPKYAEALKELEEYAAELHTKRSRKMGPR